MPANHPADGAPSRRSDLLSPPMLEALGGTLELRARRVVDGFLLGVHGSTRRGFSSEFAELRGYRPGDDLRRIDWPMYARSDRFFVREYEGETEMEGVVVMDASASMAWSSRPGELPTKEWYAVTLAAALALLLLGQGDRVGLSVFGDRERVWLPPKGGGRQKVELLRRLEEIRGSGRTEPESALRELTLRLRKRGVVIILSDLLMDPPSLITPARHLRHRGHDVRIVHLLDPGEREIPAAGSLRLQDPETGAELRVDGEGLRDRYRRAVEAAILGWRTALEPAGVGYTLVDTSLPVGHSLRAVLGSRMGIGR